MFFISYSFTAKISNIRVLLSFTTDEETGNKQMNLENPARKHIT